MLGGMNASRISVHVHLILCRGLSSQFCHLQTFDIWTMRICMCYETNRVIVICAFVEGLDLLTSSTMPRHSSGMGLTLTNPLGPLIDVYPCSSLCGTCISWYTQICFPYICLAEFRYLVLFCRAELFFPFSGSTEI